VPPEGIRLVVGLGNPGPRYARTRHNVGFRAVDAFVEEAGGTWSRSPVGEGLAAKFTLDGSDLWAAKPHTFMNESGGMVGPLARYFRIPGSSVLVVSDDMDLLLGRIRIRAKGSSGGQRGLDSILSNLGTQSVPRLRLGIGPRPPGCDAAGFVLGRFPEEEREDVGRMLSRAGDAIRAVCRDGVLEAMNAFNGKGS